jgi:hypothetical protein
MFGVHVKSYHFKPVFGAILSENLGKMEHLILSIPKMEYLSP